MVRHILGVAVLVFSLVANVSLTPAELVSREKCAEELAKRYHAAAGIAAATERAASVGGPRAARDAEEEGRIREQFRRLREETCLDPSSPDPGPP